MLWPIEPPNTSSAVGGKESFLDRSPKAFLPGEILGLPVAVGGIVLRSGNKVKERLQAGAVPVGFVCRTLSPVIVELIGLSGFDFVWIDMEHTSADFGVVEHLCRAADIHEMESLVRVPDKNPSSVLRALEVGATIINVPQVENRAEAEAVVKAAKYFPLGERGYCSSSRGVRYGFAEEASKLFSTANERVMTMVQIETEPGVQNAEEICSVPGLDIVFLGVADLSQSLGCPGEWEHPELLDRVRQLLKAIKANGKTAAMVVETVANARKWMEEGVQMLACGVDIPTFGKTLLHIRNEFRSVG